MFKKIIGWFKSFSTKPTEQEVQQWVDESMTVPPAVVATPVVDVPPVADTKAKPKAKAKPRKRSPRKPKVKPVV